MSAFQLAFALAFSCRAAVPVFSPDPDLKSLRASADLVLQGVNELLSIPVEKEKIVPLKEAIDKVARESFGASEAARALHGRAAEPALRMIAALKGKGSVESLDRRYEAASKSLEDLRGRWKESGEKAKALKEKLERARDKAQDERTKKAIERRLELLKKAWERLKGADEKLQEAEDALKKLDDSREGAKQKARRGLQAREELGKAADELSAKAAANAAAAAEARTAVDGLGTEPQHETRGRAYRKLEPVQDGGKSVWFHSDVAKNRTGSFGDLYASFNKVYAEFEAIEAGILKRAKEAGEALREAEEILEELKD